MQRKLFEALQLIYYLFSDSFIIFVLKYLQ